MRKITQNYAYKICLAIQYRLEGKSGHPNMTWPKECEGRGREEERDSRLSPLQLKPLTETHGQVNTKPGPPQASEGPQSFNSFIDGDGELRP